MGKAEKSLHVLKRVQQIFGGRVSRNRAAKGNYQAIHSWKLTGKSAINFCRLIKNYVQLKSAQFQLGGDFPTANNSGQALVLHHPYHDSVHIDSFKELHKMFGIVSKSAKLWIGKNEYPSSLIDKKWKIETIPKKVISEKKTQIRNKLKKLKLVAHDPITRELPPEYFAGCFDSEGLVSVQDLNGVGVGLCQKHPAICDALLKRYGGGIDKAAHVFNWRIRNFDSVHRFIKDVLPYSIEKREQLELVKNMPVNGAQEVAKKLREFKGNQGVEPKEKSQKIAKKRLHGLPRYLGEIIGRGKENNGKLIGYSVQWKAKMTKFTDPTQTLEQLLINAEEFLRKLVGGENPDKPTKERSLPKYIYEKNNGYMVQFKTTPSKYFYQANKSKYELLEEAKQHLAQLIAARQLAIAP